VPTKGRVMARRRKVGSPPSDEVLRRLREKFEPAKVGEHGALYRNDDQTGERHVAVSGSMRRPSAPTSPAHRTTLLKP